MRKSSVCGIGEAYRDCARQLEANVAAADNPLQRELETFERWKPDLLDRYPGKYALIKGDKFYGAFDDWPTALKEGCESFGADSPFMIRRVVEKEPPG